MSKSLSQSSEATHNNLFKGQKLKLTKVKLMSSRADVTLPALPRRSAGLLGPWSMLARWNRGRRWKRKKEKNKNFSHCLPLFLPPSLPLSLSLLFFRPTVVLGRLVGWNNSTLPLPIALPASAQSSATKRFRWKRGFGGKREMITPSKRAALSMCAHVLFLHELRTHPQCAFAPACTY